MGGRVSALSLCTSAPENNGLHKDTAMTGEVSLNIRATLAIKLDGVIDVHVIWCIIEFAQMTVT